MGKIRKSIIGICFFSLGVFLAIILLELFLFGFAYYRPSVPVNKDGSYKIVCLGNSFTEGIGAPPGESYCHHLQRILDQRMPQLKARVINLGKSSQNTHHILEKLDSVKAMEPNIALLMVGEPNFWNRYGFAKFQNQQQKYPGYSSSARANLKDFFLQLRVVRFSILLARARLENSEFSKRKDKRTFDYIPVTHSVNLGFRWLGKFYGPNFIWHMNRHKNEMEEAKASLRIIEGIYGHRNPIISLILARIAFFFENNQEEGLRWYEKSLASSESRRMFNFDLFQDLNYISRSGYTDPRVQRMLRKTKIRIPSKSVLEILPRMVRLSELTTISQSSNFRFEDFQQALGAMPGNIVLRRWIFHQLKERGAYHDAVKVLLDGANWIPLTACETFSANLAQLQYEPNFRPWLSEIERVRTQMASMFHYDRAHFQLFPEDEISHWTRAELIQIISDLKRNNIQVVLQNYPPLRNFTAPPVNELIRQVAVQKKVPFSDTFADLLEEFQREEDPVFYFSKDFGSEDPHLNSEGYRKIAEGLFNSLISSGLLPHKTP